MAGGGGQWLVAGDPISLTEFTTIIAMFIISMFWKAPCSNNKCPNYHASALNVILCMLPFQSPRNAAEKLPGELPVCRASLWPAWIPRFQSHLAGRVI